jgi:hypothetical protein
VLVEDLLGDPMAVGRRRQQAVVQAGRVAPSVPSPFSGSEGRTPTATTSPAASSDRTISPPTPYVPLVTSATVLLLI